jgi:hypothetical protein
MKLGAQVTVYSDCSASLRQVHYPTRNTQLLRLGEQEIPRPIV